MNYEKFIAEFDFENANTEELKMYDFACLKVARHSLENLLVTKKIDVQTKNELEEIQRLLNKIHANNAGVELKIEKKETYA